MSPIPFPSMITLTLRRGQVVITDIFGPFDCEKAENLFDIVKLIIIGLEGIGF